MPQDVEKSIPRSESESSHPPRRSLQHVTELLQGEVDTKMCTSVMVYACFLTGFTSAVSFTVSSAAGWERTFTYVCCFTGMLYLVSILLQNAGSTLTCRGCDRCGFQTWVITIPSKCGAHLLSPTLRGNVAQLGVAVARTFQPGAIRGFHMPDKQALCSLLSFLLGTSVGRIGDKIGNHTRKWLILATFIQALMLMAAALTAHYGEHCWKCCLCWSE
jgi:type IV secretory pathway VirB2 component (pilin)